jgi:hypothetical protein
MSNDKLHGLYGKREKTSLEDRVIKELHHHLRALMEANNNIVKQMWDNAFKLNNHPLTEEQRAELVASNEQLNQTIIKENYISKIGELKQKIIDLETQLNGYSDLASNLSSSL